MKLDFSPTSNTKIHIFNKYLFSFRFFNYISSINNCESPFKDMALTSFIRHIFYSRCDFLLYYMNPIAGNSSPFPISLIIPDNVYSFFNV